MYYYYTLIAREYYAPLKTDFVSVNRAEFHPKHKKLKYWQKNKR